MSPATIYAIIKPAGGYLTLRPCAAKLPVISRKGASMTQINLITTKTTTPIRVVVWYDYI